MRRIRLLQLLRTAPPGSTLRELLRFYRKDERLLQLLRSEVRRLGTMAAVERRLRAEGTTLVAGADEVGRGPAAGPLVAAAVCYDRLPFLPLLDDSKKLGPAEREALVPWIRAQAVSTSIQVVPVARISRGNLHLLALEAMGECCRRLAPPPHHLLVDGRHPIAALELPQTPLVKGDARSLAIASASVLAKVERDRIMVELHTRYPEYGFAAHKGYATPEHLEALARLGPSPVHRRNFAPVRDWYQGTLFTL